MNNEPIKAIRLYYFNARAQNKSSRFTTGPAARKRWDYQHAEQERAAYEQDRANSDDHIRVQAMKTMSFVKDSPWHDQKGL